MKRIKEVIKEPGDGLFDRAEVVFDYGNGIITRATLTKDELRVQRLTEKMVDSGVPEEDVLTLVEAAREEGYYEARENYERAYEEDD